MVHIYVYTTYRCICIYMQYRVNTSMYICIDSRGRKWIDTFYTW